MSNGWCIHYIIGLTPKLFFRNGFMFTKEEAEKIAQELREANPSVKFTVSNLTPSKGDD